MRALHVVKTSDGAIWAAHQAGVLKRLGVEVHVALPTADGRMVETWRRQGVALHFAPLDWPTRRPWTAGAVLRRARELVDQVKPDLIHSHFVGTTLTLRLALGGRHPVPRIFQVAGPLHLEHALFRSAELRTAGPRDFWVGSSRCIVALYRTAGVPPERLFLSYHGKSTARPAPGKTDLRARLGIPADWRLVGNMNLMYPPKWYLGQRVGLKCHEDVIDAIAAVKRDVPRVAGVLVGAQFGRGNGYEQRLRAYARARAGAAIHLPGLFTSDEVLDAWPQFDLGVHVPISENCGGVDEALAAGVPVIASSVGGLPEVVVDGVTGFLVPPRRPDLLAERIRQVLSSPATARETAVRGRVRVLSMFDVERTAREVHDIYQFVLGVRRSRPPEYVPPL
jgi:glycosyltransferase involved in cell wall biosynthesis